MQRLASVARASEASSLSIQRTSVACNTPLRWFMLRASYGCNERFIGCWGARASSWSHSTVQGNASRSILLAAAALSFPLFSTSTGEASQCDTTSSNENPLWPSGVSSKMLSKYVDEILEDPSVSMRAVPDSIERIIYLSTVRVTLNAVYEALSTLHGTEFLGHEIVLERRADSDDMAGLDFANNFGKIDYSVLEAMADELLKHKAVNQRWLPDMIERQVYANCLLIFFVILDKVADTISIRLCGHELSLSFEPLTKDKTRKLAEKRQRTELIIDSAAMDAIVKETVAESKRASHESGVPVSSSLFYESFLKALHKTLYSLILGIVDDLLSKTEIKVLKDSIYFRLEPKIAQSPPNDNALVMPNTEQQMVIVALENELEEVRSREMRARYAVYSLATIAVVVAAMASASRR